MTPYHSPLRQVGTFSNTTLGALISMCTATCASTTTTVSTISAIVLCCLFFSFLHSYIPVVVLPAPSPSSTTPAHSRLDRQFVSLLDSSAKNDTASIIKSKSVSSQVFASSQRRSFSTAAMVLKVAFEFFLPTPHELTLLCSCNTFHSRKTMMASLMHSDGRFVAQNTASFTDIH